MTWRVFFSYITLLKIAIYSLLMRNKIKATICVDSSHFSTPVTPEWRPYSVPTAFKKFAERRGARCANASNAVQTLCNRIERHAAAFSLSMLKTNAAAWLFQSVLDSTLWQRCGVF